MSFSSMRESPHGPSVTQLIPLWCRDRSRTSVRQYDSPSRGQTTPIVALVALFAVCAGVSLYATTLDSVLPTETVDGLAEPTLDRMHDAMSTGGVVSPSRLDRAGSVAPDGYHVAVAITAADRRWTSGRQPPAEVTAGRVESAERPVSVRLADGRVVWGRLSVRVWR